MKNETYLTIDGLFSLFPEYIGYKKRNDYKNYFDTFIERIYFLL
jgi:hypothetical protein